MKSRVDLPTDEDRNPKVGEVWDYMESSIIYITHTYQDAESVIAKGIQLHPLPKPAGIYEAWNITRSGIKAGDYRYLPKGKVTIEWGDN